MNRISMGAQTFHPEMRKRLGRRDTAEECFRAVKVAHAAGVGSVNIDIMYGYPGQTVEMFAQDLQAVEELAPDSCDFYYYMQIMNTPYREMIAKARYAAADGEVPLQAMRELLLKKFAAWNMLTMETFARLACTAPRIWSVTCGGSSGVAELIAVGPSCYGQVRGHYYYNQPDLSSWLQHIESGLLPVRSKIVLHGKVLAIRRLFGSVLMGRLDEATYAALPRGLRRRVGHWLQAGLMRRDANGDLRLTRSGQVRFQMLEAECVPALHAFVMMRRYMLSFPEQRALLFRDTEVLYAHSIRSMMEGSLPGLRQLRRLGYWLLLRLPDSVLEWLVTFIQRLAIWTSR